ncbi:two-component system response regulator [Paucibacter sp. APW11]|uniref:Two-component system response regulator n=1 Tax=Roseateles aquae TaxID=3077235 RepID=A0ABU3PIM4_9BURK|nr:two-component system response regulator [Paucibacter sp. APW11]MDT9002309.1 two-component system response regulator [Paucibacter sp. APW11]
MHRPTVLVVDDEPLNLAVLSKLLNPQYRVLGARSAASALALLSSELPDLILLDIMMPEVDGYAMLAKLKADPRTCELPVIFVTALGAEQDEERGFAEGAVDYIVKPIKPAVALARVRTQLELKRSRDRLADQNSWLEAEVARRTHESLIAQDLTLCALAELAETRDNETGNHILRTQGYVEALARQLQPLSGFAEELNEAQLLRIVKAAPMHDIGKIGIQDHILLKPGRLTPEEFEIMKTHARIGGQAIERALSKVRQMHQAGGDDDSQPLPESIRFLEVARTIANHHHERWDGSGYPDGLSGTAIPLAARLMALADVFDALTMRRVYKEPWPVEKAIAHIEAEAGKHFDPTIVAAFVNIQAEFRAIAARLSD